MTPVKAKRWKRQVPCHCIGYHFPHRKGGGACEFSSRADYYAALRQEVPWAREFLSAADLRRMEPLEGDI